MADADKPAEDTAQPGDAAQPGDTAQPGPGDTPAEAAPARPRARSRSTGGDGGSGGEPGAPAAARRSGQRAGRRSAPAAEPAGARAPAAGEPPAAAASGRAGLKLHHLRPAPGARKAKTRVGRGEASKGKTAGRGTKGTKARDSVAPRFEGGQMPLHRRLPKLKGFSNAKFKITYQVVNTGRLAELYPQGGEVTPGDLVAKGAVRDGELVKVLGAGDVAAVLRVTAHAFSDSAKEKIIAAGGSVTEL